MSREGTIPQRLIRSLTDHLGTKVVSVIIAVVLWGVVLGSRSVEVTKEVPVEVMTSPDVVTANEVPDRILFRLSGPKAFLRPLLDRREDPIRINLDGVKPSLITYRFFSDSIRVPIGVKVLAVNPAAVQIKLEYLKRKDVPIRVETRGALSEGLKLGSVQVKPEVVRIKGPESRVDAVSEVFTKPIDLSEIKKTTEREIPLDLLKLGVQIDGPLPKAMIELEQNSANFRIKNVDIRVLSPYKVRIEEKSVTVLVRASQKELESLDRSQVYATVDLRERGKGKFLESVRVTLPSAIGLVKVVPDHVLVTVY